tara:strand:- start:1093 stop:2058 length:966 start_codon:yes stop_codon:yes gene_type:complete
MKYLIACDLALESPMYSLPNSIYQKLISNYPIDIVFVNSPGYPEINSNASIYWGNRIEPEMILKMPELKWVHFGSVGVNRLNNRIDLNEKLIITSSKGIVNSSMVTNIISLTGIFIRRLDIFFKKKETPYTRSDYDLYFDQIKDFQDIKILIIGLGNIGKELAERFYGLGSIVDGLSRSKKKYNFLNRNYISLANITQLEKYDVIISLLPENEKTHNFFDDNFFSQTSKDLIFMNFGRGSALNEGALLRSFKKGSPRIAILDVTNIEPTPTKSKLFNNPNIFLTPHIGAFSPSYWEKECRLFEHNLKKFISQDFDYMLNRF